VEKAMVLQTRFFYVVNEMSDRLALSDECAPPVPRCAVFLINTHTKSCGLDKGSNELRTD
jgi:hypothetical protein